ncbi:EAL domain-containing protein [Octadecabacter sp. G9-8]|uniref:EAL domain-containing protein n=1 Tax=Octadecabacter dasysiphoniae TaxID=2909341 RepID=A0ABS9CWV2_9RHOB|nr:EAL domain-containing protein [Octadecabacter dasysiphoniae]MCF2870884.1 EAL domain-containing protein [Octadecabacter dasysiphoniae]
MVLLALVLLLSPALVLYFWERVGMRGKLQKTQHRLSEILKEADIHRLASENASDGLLIQDMRGRIVWCNPAYCRIHGRTSEEMLGRHPREFAPPPEHRPPKDVIDAFRFNTNDPGYAKLQLFENQHKDGHLFWNQISVSFKTLRNGREYAIAVCRDITEQIEQEKALRTLSLELEHEASHDSLTGVPNRAAFMSFFENMLNNTDHPHVGLLHIDMDDFKSINDTHGHSAGDAVLIHAAAAVRSHIRSSDLVARVGGDEFVVVCLGINRHDQLQQLANDLIDVISEPFEWTNRTLQSEASIGAVLSSRGANGTENLLVQADFALYEAKGAGRNRVALYDEYMHERHNYLNRRSAELIDVVDTDALKYFFQPTMDLATGAVIGFETLVRWEHPIDGIIPPDHFLPLAKDLGLMGALDLLSMTAALKEKRRLTLAGFPDIKMAFNASPELLTHPEFINRLIWGVEAGNIHRSDITIEVLETTNFGEVQETSSHAAIIGDLRSAGFNVHLDDFGVGFAGLSHLATLDVTGVKVDRSLVKDILTDPVSQKIVRKIIELSNDLGLCVIAEGVEDQDTAAELGNMGCNVIQGYWLSRPLPQDCVDDWLRQHIQSNAARSA